MARVTEIGDEVYLFWVDIESRLDSSPTEMTPRVFRTRGTYLGTLTKVHKGTPIEYTYIRAGDWDVNACEYRELNAIPSTNVLKVQVIKRVGGKRCASSTTSTPMGGPSLDASQPK